MQQPSSIGAANAEIERLVDAVADQAHSAGVDADLVQRLRHEAASCSRREEVVRRREQELKALVENAPDVIARFDRQFRCSYVNPQIECYTGKRPDQFMGKTHRENGFPAPVCDLWEGKLREVFATQRRVTFEFETIWPAGQVYCHQARLVPEMDPATHQVESVICLCRDITETKRAEEALRENQEWIRSLFDHNLDAIVLMDQEGRFTAVNSASERISGYSREELLKKTFIELCTPDCVEETIQAFQQDRDGHPQVIEMSIFAKDGHRIELLATGGPIMVKGRIVGVFAILKDITERKRIEKALQESEEQFRLLVDGVKDYAMFLLDPKGNIVNWNKGAERLKGYRAEEIIGRNSSLCFVPDDILQGEPQRRLEAAAQQGHYKGECWVVRKDGSKFWAEVQLTALRNEDGSLRGYAEVAQDITERKRVEEELKRAKEAAEQASRAKDQFLAVLSHELRTPLTPVLATLQLMAKDPSLLPQQHESLSMMGRNVELEARLIDDLLDLTRITRGKQELHLEPVDLHSVLRHVTSVCESEIRSKQLKLTVQLHAAHPYVQGDVARLEQVFWNLLKNAVKFTPAGGSIILRTEQTAADRVVVTLSDNGVGIEPELLPFIFNVFEQGGAGTTRRFGGLGLGLAISKGLVDLHGGTLTAQSEGKGKGATFTVELRAAAAPAGGHLSRSEASGAVGLKGGRLLLVEDHPDTAKTMAMLLQSYGFEVRIANSMASALQAAEMEKFDLLLSDIGLPDGSGLELMRQLRAKHPIRGIALSGFGMEEDIRRSKEAGFAAHLTKPVSLAKLEEVLREVEGGR